MKSLNSLPILGFEVVGYPFFRNSLRTSLNSFPNLGFEVVVSVFQKFIKYITGPQNWKKIFSLSNERF